MSNNFIRLQGNGCRLSSSKDNVNGQTINAANTVSFIEGW